MIIDKQLKHLVKDLLDHRDVELMLNGSKISMHVFDDHHNLQMSTPVYFGGNYIPKSVRLCLNQKPPFESEYVRTFLSVDEDQFQISLNYKGNLTDLHSDAMIPVLHEFAWLADEWKLYLDQHDKNDLVHVRVKI